MLMFSKSSSVRVIGRRLRLDRALGWRGWGLRKRLWGDRHIRRERKNFRTRIELDWKGQGCDMLQHGNHESERVHRVPENNSRLSLCTRLIGLHKLRELAHHVWQLRECSLETFRVLKECVLPEHVSNLSPCHTYLYFFLSKFPQQLTGMFLSYSFMVYARCLSPVQGSFPTRLHEKINFRGSVYCILSKKWWLVAFYWLIYWETNYSIVFF